SIPRIQAVRTSACVCGAPVRQPTACGTPLAVPRKKTGHEAPLWGGPREQVQRRRAAWQGGRPPEPNTREAYNGRIHRPGTGGDRLRHADGCGHWGRKWGSDWGRDREYRAWCPDWHGHGGGGRRDLRGDPSVPVLLLRP